MLWCAPTLEQPKFAVLVTAQHGFAGWRRGSPFICLTAMTQDFKTLYGILRHFLSQNQLVKGCGCKYCATQCTSKHFQCKYIQYNTFFLSGCCLIFFSYLFCNSTMLVWRTAAPFCSMSVSHTRGEFPSIQGAEGPSKSTMKALEPSVVLFTV